MGHYRLTPFSPSFLVMGQYYRRDRFEDDYNRNHDWGERSRTRGLSDEEMSGL